MSGQTFLVTCMVRDPSTGDLIDVSDSADSTFTLIDVINNSTVYTETFDDSGGTLVTHPSTGVYQFSFDSSTYTSEYIVEFRCQLTSDVFSYKFFVKSIASKYYKYVAMLRQQIDKSNKTLFDDLENMDKPTFQPAVTFLYGYEDKNMVYYLDKGMTMLNAIPPYTALTMELFPDNFGSVLIDAATIAALEAQAILSIDIDYNYSLGGQSLVVEHHGKLNAQVAQLLGRFDKAAIAFKRLYTGRGTVLYQWSPAGMRSSRVYNSMPVGMWSRLLSTWG